MHLQWEGLLVVLLFLAQKNRPRLESGRPLSLKPLQRCDILSGFSISDCLFLTNNNNCVVLAFTNTTFYIRGIYFVCYLPKTIDPSLGTTETKSVSQAIQSALEILGPVSKQRLFRQLRDYYNIDIWSTTPLDLNELEQAITDIFGKDVATLLMKIVNAEIDRTWLLIMWLSLQRRG